MDFRGDVLVSIICLAYNHEGYIRQCLEGFVMQKTNFHFEAIVHDDASTDRTASIIREFAAKYPEIIKPIYETENQYSKHDGSIRRIMNAETRGKYIAMCEGDDYWTDPLKLQEQVDFLESHPDYSLCCHRYKIYEEKSDTWAQDYVADLFEQNPDGFSFTSTDNFHHWITKTMTMLYRREALPEGIWRNFRYYRDVHMCYYLLQSGPGFCMPDDMAVYRRHDGGIFSPLSQKGKDGLGVEIYGELYDANRHDDELKIVAKSYLDTYFNDYIRLPLAKRQVGEVSLSDFIFCVRQNRIFKGWKSFFVIAIKCLKSYAKAPLAK